MIELVTEAAIEFARAEGADLWSVGNATLYRLCAERPTHTCARDTIAKLWLIGRSYSAAIERRRTARETTKRTVDEYYEEAARRLAASDLDTLIARVPREPPTYLAGVVPALEAHACLVDVLHALSGRKQRSFASKYLHFHVPEAFFILDSIACRGLQRLKLQRPVERLSGGVGEPEYLAFVTKVLTLQTQLASMNDSLLTPREMDRLLLRLGA